jgi:TatD DNase family protein
VTAPRYVDSHCHVAGPEFDLDREAVLVRARQAGVETALVVGVMDGQAGHTSALEVSARWGLPCAVGVHPHEARLADERADQEISGLARAGQIVAIGEIGLDFHYDLSPRDVQGEVFRRQISLARGLRLPVIVHTREAEAETLAILEEENARDVGGVVHCFTGTLELARRAVELGFFVSFSGIVAFPRAGELREVARWVPAERLLVETDAPYLAPPPHRGRRNEPAFVVQVTAAGAPDERELRPLLPSADGHGSGLTCPPNSGNVRARHGGELLRRRE